MHSRTGAWSATPRHQKAEEPAEAAGERQPQPPDEEPADTADERQPQPPDEGPADTAGERQPQPLDEGLAEAPRPSAGRLIAGWLRSVLETIVPAVLIALFINLFLAQATQVHGQSMEPNLHTRQRLVVEKITYRFHGPRRGDIVVLRLPERGSELLIKRVIGQPGETVEIRAGRVYVDGQMLDEPYLDQVTRGEMAPTTVPPLKVFVLGDNRNFSNDSRSFGMVPIENVIGQAWLSYWPPEDFGLVR